MRVIVVATVVAVISLLLVLLAYTRPSGLSLPPSVKSMKKYIINLDRRADRMAVTVPKLSSFGFTDAVRWPAIDARLMHRSDVERLVRPDAIAPIWSNRRTKHHELSIGAVGCYLSHIQIWASLDREPAMIFEDDTDPTLTSGDVRVYTSVYVYDHQAPQVRLVRARYEASVVREKLREVATDERVARCVVRVPQLVVRAARSLRFEDRCDGSGKRC